MANNLNLCQFIGNLGKDPETRFTQSGSAVCSFSVAVNSQWKDKAGAKQEHTEWVRVTSFGKLAEICDKYLTKGSKVYVSGRMKTDKWTNKEGVDQYTTGIVADNLEMLGGRDSSHSSGQQSSQASQPGKPPADDFDDVPF